MPGTPEGAGLERLLAERGSQLMRVAIALTGNREADEDLMQAALERVLRPPRHVDSDIEAYVRRVLSNLAADAWRRRGRAAAGPAVTAGPGAAGPVSRTRH